MRRFKFKQICCFMQSLMLVATTISGYSAIAEGETVDKSSDYSKVELDVDSPFVSMETDDAHCNLFNYIDEEEFNSHDFAYRVPSEESLNTYVYQDNDGYRTVYILDDYTKFNDTNGNVIEKDLRLVETENGYTVTKNDIGLLMPYNLNDGIYISYLDTSISMLPSNENDDMSVAKATDVTVTYENAFGENTALTYTPTFSGIKEDIIISEYNRVSTYAFSLITNGLYLENEKEDSNTTFSSADSDISISLSQIEIYDAEGTPCKGDFTIYKNDSDNNYTFEIKIDEQFLEEALYPVIIDPSLTISDNTHGANAIQDVPIFAGYPNSNFVGYIYDRVGTPSYDYGVGRTVVRLNGLINYSFYQNIPVNRIESVKFNVLEGSGGATHTINVYPLNNSSWSEYSVTWNNIGTFSTSHNYSNTLSCNQWTAFDIIELVKGWKNGTYDANAGFIMKNSNETLNKNFYSSEYGTTSYRPYIVFTYYAAGSGGGDSFSNATNLNLNSVKDVTIAYPFEKRYFKFRPIVSTEYMFFSIG